MKAEESPTPTPPGLLLPAVTDEGVINVEDVDPELSLALVPFDSALELLS